MDAIASLFNNSGPRNSMSDASTATWDDWRVAAHPTDLLWALNSLYSHDDFTNKATLKASASDTVGTDIDLLIQGINFTLAEHIQITPHVGNTFGCVCFGKAPLIASISAILMDTDECFGKQYLIDTYKNKLRLGAVARTGKIPALTYHNTLLRGPLLSMRVTENSTSEETIIVIFSQLVTNLHIISPEGTLDFDYIHGAEDATNNPVDNSWTKDYDVTKDLLSNNKNTVNNAWVQKFNVEGTLLWNLDKQVAVIKG